MQQRLPARVKILVATVAIVAGSLLCYVALTSHRLDWGIALSFGLFIFLAEQFPVTMPLGIGSYSVSFVLMIAAIILGGPAEAGIASGLGFMTIRGARSVHPARHAFNASNYVLASVLAGIAFDAAKVAVGVGTIDRASGLPFPTILVPVAAATAIHFVANSSLVSLVVALVRGDKASSVWRDQYRAILAGYIAFAALAVVLAALYLEMGAASVVFLLVPLLVARGAIQSAFKMEGAYEATVRSLIQAIEAKDPYTRGHAERVAKLSEMTARQYGLSSEECRVIRYIALMHDVGKLGVSTKILAKPGKLTDDEYEHMKLHPIRGYEIVTEIDFLKRAAETAVRHHHERMDGRGYPDGLKGEEIPVIARIVMCCDAFDSMTSTRVYRKAKSIEDALAELHRCVDTQFDRVSLAALERALEVHGWEAEPETDDEVIPGGAAVAL